MYEETGVFDFEAPLTFWVDSNTTAWKWYIVDVALDGVGACNCKHGRIAYARANNGKPWRRCAHLKRAREFVAERVRRGDYDHLLKTL